MFKIAKEFTFDAAHILKGMPEGHPCGRLHGHTYTVIIELESVKEVTNEFDPIQKYIDTYLDHRFLNDTLLINPTVELLARHIYTAFLPLLPGIQKVSVQAGKGKMGKFP